jgi:hypothetical protein
VTLARDRRVVVYMGDDERFKEATPWPAVAHRT